MEYFGKTYRKSVLETMGSTGIIRPEFRGPLEDLQKRLGLSEEDCNKIFRDAVKEKMVPMVEWIVSEFERTQLTQQQLSQRRSKDMGEDLFQTGKGATVSLEVLNRQIVLGNDPTHSLLLILGHAWSRSRRKSYGRYYQSGRFLHRK